MLNYRLLTPHTRQDNTPNPPIVSLFAQTRQRQTAMATFFAIVLSLYLPLASFSSETAQGKQRHSYRIALVQQRWHTGIVGDSALLRCLAQRLAPIPRNATGIDIGWGDSVFYQLPDFELDAALAALFLPTPAVLRIAFFSIPVARYLRAQERVVEIPLTAEQFDQLCNFLRHQFRHTDTLPTQKSTTTVRFYPAVGTYSIFKTCNTWIAEALTAIGVLRGATGIITVEALFNRLCQRYRCFQR